MVAILMATMPQRKQFIKTARQRVPRPVSLMGCALTTQHRMLAFSDTLHCYVCHKHSTSTAQGRRLFLQSPCIVNHALVNANFYGMAKPIAIPSGTAVQVGRAQLHSSHTLLVFKG